MSRQDPLVWAGALILIVTLCRLALLWVSPWALQFDEAQYWHWAQDLAWGYYSKPPGVAAAIAVSTAICGDGEACIRSPAPLLHAATAAGLAWLALQLGAGRRAAALAALLYASMPAVTWSSAFISTDVPLLTFWVLGLAGLCAALDAPTDWRRGCLPGLCIGLGLLSKYAMIYSLLGLVVLAMLDPRARRLLWAPAGWTMLAVAALVFAPNLLWNAALGWPTLGHTADNANWQGQGADPLGPVGFLATQAGLVGPLTALAFGLWLCSRPWRTGTGRLLLAFSLPILLLLAGQALVSRANANWAATALPAVVLGAALWLRQRDRRWWAGTALALNLAVGLVFVAWQAGSIWRDPPEFLVAVTDRMTGWPEAARQVSAIAGRHDALPILFDDRKTMASLAYYAHDLEVGWEETRLRRWLGDGPIRDHYALVAPQRALAPDQAALYVTPWVDSVIGNSAVPLGTVVVPTVRDRAIRLYVFRVKGPA